MSWESKNIFGGDMFHLQELKERGHLTDPQLLKYLGGMAHGALGAAGILYVALQEMDMTLPADARTIVLRSELLKQAREICPLLPLVADDLRKRMKHEHSAEPGITSQGPQEDTAETPPPP